MLILTANGKFLYNYSIDSYLPKPLAHRWRGVKKLKG